MQRSSLPSGDLPVPGIFMERKKEVAAFTDRETEAWLIHMERMMKIAQDPRTLGSHR